MPPSGHVRTAPSAAGSFRFESSPFILNFLHGAQNPRKPHEHPFFSVPGLARGVHFGNGGVVRGMPKDMLKDVITWLR